MSIVIDVNAFSMVFDVVNSEHKDFAPIKAWLESGGGFLIYGGTKYIKELTECYRHLRLVRQLRDAGIAVEIKASVVDEIERGVVKGTTGTACNDQHIIALLAASHCSILCSRDSSSFEFIKDRSLYPKGSPKVRIYCSRRNVGLLRRYRRTDIRNAAG